MKIVGISGSLRKGSYNTALLRAAQELAPDDMRIEMEAIAQIPLYNADSAADGFPPIVNHLVERIRQADGLLIATPEYNYSIPGGLKNAIDWVSRAEDQPFNGKAIALMGASMGLLESVRAQYHLRQVFVFLNAMVLNRPEVFVGAAHEKHDESGELAHQATRDFLSDYLKAVKDWVASVNQMRP